MRIRAGSLRSAQILGSGNQIESNRRSDVPRHPPGRSTTVKGIPLKLMIASAWHVKDYAVTWEPSGLVVCVELTMRSEPQARPLRWLARFPSRCDGVGLPLSEKRGMWNEFAHVHKHAIRSRTTGLHLYAHGRPTSRELITADRAPSHPCLLRQDK